MAVAAAGADAEAAAVAAACALPPRESSNRDAGPDEAAGDDDEVWVDPLAEASFVESVGDDKGSSHAGSICLRKCDEASSVCGPNRPGMDSKSSISAMRSAANSSAFSEDCCC